MIRTDNGVIYYLPRNTLKDSAQPSGGYCLIHHGEVIVVEFQASMTNFGGRNNLSTTHIGSHIFYSYGKLF